MTKPYGMVAAAALAVGGLTMIGCHNNNPDTNPTASVGGVGGGGSTDSYGTGPDARMRSTGNIGVNSGGASGTAAAPQPAVTAGERTPENQPPQTPSSPAGGTGGAGSGTSATGTGNYQGSTTGNEAGAGVRTSTNGDARGNAGTPANGNANNQGAGATGSGR